jgi:hypothetical protein
MAKHNRTQLMAHPLSQSLAKKKFYRCGCEMFSLFFSVYFTFIAIFTIIAARMTHPQKYYNHLNFTFNNELCENVLRDIDNGPPGGSGMKKPVDDMLKLVLYILIILLLVKNLWIICGFIQVHWTKIFTFLLETGATCLSFAFIWDNEYQKNVTMRCPTQWQYGAFGLLIGYLGLLYYIQYIPFIGIYVIMLKLLFIRLIFFVPVFMCLIFGFGIAFHMLLQYEDAFDPFLSHALSKIGIL